MPNWLIPWIVAAVAVWPLVQIEKRVHRQIQALGLLLTNNPQAAVLIYYLALLPGVALHEGSQWLLAQILRVKIKKFQLWPEKRGKLIRLGLVEIDDKTDPIRATLIGMVPLATGVAAIAIIGGWRFDVQALLSALGTGDLPSIIQGFNVFVSTPDFWFWIYLVFAVANAMLPEPHDRINWWLPVGVVGALTAFLLVLDLGIVLKALLEGFFFKIASALSFTLVMALVVDLFMLGLIWVLIEIFSRLLNRELEYQ